MNNNNNNLPRSLSNNLQREKRSSIKIESNYTNNKIVTLQSLSSNRNNDSILDKNNNTFNSNSIRSNSSDNSNKNDKSENSNNCNLFNKKIKDICDIDKRKNDSKSFSRLSLIREKKEEFSICSKLESINIITKDNNNNLNKNITHWSNDNKASPKHSPKALIKNKKDNKKTDNPQITDELTNSINTSTDNRNKILIVDDAETIRKSLRRVLNSDKELNKDFQIIEAKDGIEILSIVMKDQTEGNKIKIIITDENMEYMTGSNAISILRQLEKENKIRPIYIVSLTAFTDESTKDEIMRKGADYILYKPFSVYSKKLLFSNYNLVNIER